MPIWGPEEEAFAAARNDRNSPLPPANRGSIWKHQCACLQRAAAAATASSNVFGLPTSFAAPLPQEYIIYLLRFLNLFSVLKEVLVDHNYDALLMCVVCDVLT